MGSFANFSLKPQSASMELEFLISNTYNKLEVKVETEEKKLNVGTGTDVSYFVPVTYNRNCICEIKATLKYDIVLSEIELQALNDLFQKDIPAFIASYPNRYGEGFLSGVISSGLFRYLGTKYTEFTYSLPVTILSCGDWFRV